jgi:hypothetical protein
LSRRTFLSPRLFDYESLARNSRSHGRRVGCKACSEWMLQRDHALCHCEVADYARSRPVLSALRSAASPPPLAAPPLADGVGPSPESLSLCSRCAAIECGTFKNPEGCVVAPPAAGAQDAAAGATFSASAASVADAASTAASNAASWIEKVSSGDRRAATSALASAGATFAGLFSGGGGSASGGGPLRSAALVAQSCAAASAQPMTLEECQAAAGTRGFGRKWLGTSEESKEAAGCIQWEENGNVKFNKRTEQQPCNLRGTCLVPRVGWGARFKIIGTPPAGGGEGNAAC